LQSVNGVKHDIPDWVAAPFALKATKEEEEEEEVEEEGGTPHEKSGQDMQPGRQAAAGRQAVASSLADALTTRKENIYHARVKVNRTELWANLFGF
jgi:hypothetical protein